MSIKKIEYYTVKCDRCENKLEDYTGELAGKTCDMKTAILLAKENGFIQMDNVTFICPQCIKNMAQKRQKRYKLLPLRSCSENVMA